MKRLVTAAIAAALLLAAPAGAATPDLAAAKTFVAGLYAAYTKHPGPDYAGAQAKTTFSADLIALMHRADAATPKGDVGPLDGDPICDCQDYEITAVAVEVAAVDATHARAQVTFKNVGQPQQITLDLVAGPVGWRIGDVHSPSTPSLVGLLRDSLKP